MNSGSATGVRQRNWANLRLARLTRKVSMAPGPQHRDVSDADEAGDWNLLQALDPDSCGHESSGDELK